MIDSTTYKGRFMVMVVATGNSTRAAFADFLGVSKQVVQNWYARDGAIPQDRRHLIQDRTGFSIDWVNDGVGPQNFSRLEEQRLEYPPTSQTTRLDPEKVREAYQAVRAIYADNGKDYDIEAEPDLFATVYERLVSITGRPSIVEMARIGRVIEERQQGAKDDRNERAERPGGAHPEASKGRAAS